MSNEAGKSIIHYLDLYIYAMHGKNISFFRKENDLWVFYVRYVVYGACTFLQNEIDRASVFPSNTNS